MEGVLARQYQLMQGIETIFINFKKDGPERKTYSNVQKRINILQTYWNEFNSNHTQLSEYQDLNHEYFKQNSYETTKIYFGKLMSYLELFSLYTEDPITREKPATPSLGKLTSTEAPEEESKEEEKLPLVQISTPSVSPRTTTLRAESIIPSLNKPKSPLPAQGETQHPIEHRETINRGNSSRLEEMLRKQNSNFKAFSRTITNINFDTISEKWEFEDVLKHIESRWSTIDSLHWDIDSELYEENQEYEKVFSRYEREYNDIKKALNQKMWTASYKTQSTPTMDIPVFNGDYHRWVSFKDLFNEAIHSNRSMSNAQKMQFLKSKVKGEAEKLIQHLNISSDNYEVCWDILNHRYNNNKLIFSSHINILMSLPSMQQQTASLIKKIHDTANECLNAIRALGVNISTWDPLLVHILSQKLDPETHKDYIESVKNPRELPSLSEFFTFLESKFTSLEASRRKQDSTIVNQKATMQNYTYTKRPADHNFIYNKRPIISHKPIAKSFYATSANKCIQCSGNHAIYNCKDFLDMPSDTKMKLINKYRLCVNCLYDHKGNKCISTKTCRKCMEPHNTLLHDAFIKQSIKPNTDHVNVSQNQSAEILLATAQIKILAKDGTYHSMRALIDQGSQISLITENAAQKLGLPRRHCKGVVFGLGARENNCKGAMNIAASAIHGDFKFEANVFIMNNLINNLPNQSFQKPKWSHIENINLADPEFYVSRPVDLLLGADIYALIMLGGIIKGENDTQPIAQQTHLGWLLCGNVKTYQCNVILNNIDDIQRFWSIEDIADNPSNMSVGDHHCIQQYKEQTTRQADGRYVVRLPMKPETMEKLGESKQRAIAQFLQLERKFIKNQKISEGYKSFINEYIDLGHMYEARSVGNLTPACYLPHHCVLRADSTTTALRVVFNASSPTSSGHCLNDLMHSGPNLQQDLLSLILRWRQYEVAFTADIEKMFRQILVHHDDQNLQKIIWRDNPNQLLREYNLATVTYGMKAAPFLAMMTLKQLAKDEGHKYSSPAKRALEEDFYMDDLLSGSHSIASAKQLQKDLMNLLQSGGFNLRKWSCNKPEVLQGETTPNQESFNFKYPESTKTLGLRWNPQDEHFSFQLKLQSTSSKSLTKRILLSEISKVFDPLGWLAPVTTKLKLLFQQVWQHEVQWDSQLPEELSKEWLKNQEELENINNIKVPRWLETGENEDIELHGFCDSSSKAYACVIYCKVKKHSLEDNQHSSINIVAAKSRLVPLKKNITLPRLELMSCLLLSKLMEKVLKTLPNHNITMFGWSDSTAALGWLQGDSSRWKPFVANKVERIKTTKGYIAVFVCMVTKAIHLELVSDLSSSAFLAAMRRMAARRGAPRHVYCDNGTNFVGASRMLKQEYINLEATLDQEFFEQISDMEIEFHFNAPSWPSAGGLWEAAVKSLKHHLRRVLGEQKLTFEEFSTLLSQLEACLNSRPLCALSEDPEDTNILTPSHFLASGPTLTIVETEHDERTRWQLTQKIFQDIWKRWQTDYLCQLTKRSKWQQHQPNQKVGDIVIIHDANLPAGKWSLGRVVELHPGRDGVVRVVSVKTKNGVLQRPIIKLSPLPVNADEKPETHQGEEQQSSTKKQSRPKNITSTFKAMAITLLMMFLILPAHCAYNIAQLTSNQSIYLDKISDMHLNRDEWKLVVYYDMNPYWDGCQMLTTYLNNLGNICYKERKPPLCDVIMLQLRHSYVELDLYNHMLLGQQIAGTHPRVRRGLINGVGNIARSLFGVLDDKFAQQYEKDIELLRINQKHMALLWKNQTSIVEAEHNLLQRVEETMNKQYKLINQHFNKIEKMANTVKDEVQSTIDNNNFALSVITANNVLLNLKKVQDYLLDTIVDLHSGTFNIHLITPEQLRDELNIISGQLSKDLSLPINNIPNDLSKLYHMLKVKAKMTKQFFIFEIKIPLIDRDFYEIYHLIPIQHKVQDSMISTVPISKYVAMNIQKDLYFPISQSDLQRCSIYNDVTYLCPLQRPVYHMTSDNSLCIKNLLSNQCKMNSAICSTTWTELHKVNTHLYSSCDQCTVRIICGSQVTAEQLIGSGIISLSDDCVIKGTTFTIYSHRQQNNALNIEADVLKIEIPSINHLINLSVPTINETNTLEQINQYNHTYMKRKLDEIGKQIHQIKETGAEVVQSDEVSSHDIIQYVMIILVIIICTSAVFIWRRITARQISFPNGSSAGSPAPPASSVPRVPPAARTAPPAHTPPPPQPAARPTRGAPDQPQHQHSDGDGIESSSDIEMTESHYATVTHKATSPTFRNHFSK